MCYYVYSYMGTHSYRGADAEIAAGVANEYTYIDAVTAAAGEVAVHEADK